MFSSVDFKINCYSGIFKRETVNVSENAALSVVIFGALAMLSKTSLRLWTTKRL